MATGTHTWTDTSATTSGTKNNEVRSWDVRDAYVNNICKVIPRYSKIDKVKVSVDGKQNLSLSTGDIELYFTFLKDVYTEKADQIYHKKNGLTNSYKTFSIDVTSYFTMFSESGSAGLVGVLSNNYPVYYLLADCHSTVIRKFSLKNASLYYEFTYPTFTIKVSAEGQGDVSGGGTWDVKKTTQTKTITATPKTGYKFLHWVDNRGNTYKDATTNISFNDDSTFVDSFSSVLKCVAVFDPISYTITANKIGGGYVSGAGNHSYGKTVTLTAVPEEGYRFVEWLEDKSTENPRSFTVTGDATYTAVFEKSIYNVNFRNIDGSIYSTSKIVHGSTLGTIPTPTRSGYEFAGWLPCAPAKDLYGNVLDSRYYGGLTSYPLAQNYKYADKFTLHIEAHMSKWSDIKGRQIISCTEGGGWSLGYQAGSETAGRGAEIYSSSGYKIINFGYENFKDNDWYTFDLIFNNGTFEAYVNGEKKGSVSTGSSTLSYNSTNTIFVGAEAGGNTETPTGNYFNGTISNVFIANKGERFTQPTSELVIYNQMDFYPTWRRLPTYKVEFLNYDNSLLQLDYYSQGTTPTYTGSIPTKPSDENYRYEFSGWNQEPSPITKDMVYIAQFRAIQLYKLTVNQQGKGTVYIQPEGPYEYDTLIFLQAYPDQGYKFVKWSDGDTNNQKQVHIKKDTSLTAIFEELEMVFKSVKIYYPTENDLITSDKFIWAGDRAQVVVQVALE